MKIGRSFCINGKIDNYLSLIHELEEAIKDEIEIGYYKPKDIKVIISKKLKKNGWTPKLKVYSNSNKYIHFFKDGTGLQVQMGHYGQAYVDILKIALASASKKISLGVIMVLGNENAKDGNNASFEGVTQDLGEYDLFLDCPYLVLEIK